MAVCPLHPTSFSLSHPHFRLSGLAIGAGFALAGALLGQLTQPSENNPRCSTCDGAGYIECICQRWSSSNSIRAAGCESCRGSLRRRCPACRGGGTGVPSFVPIPVRVKDGVDSMFGIFLGFLGRGVSVRGRRSRTGTVGKLVAKEVVFVGERKKKREIVQVA